MPTTRDWDPVLQRVHEAKKAELDVKVVTTKPEREGAAQQCVLNVESAKQPGTYETIAWFGRKVTKKDAEADLKKKLAAYKPKEAVEAGPVVADETDPRLEKDE